MGALFSHPTAAMSWDEVQAYVGQHRVPVWAADADGAPIDAVPSGAVALAVSNEGSGLSGHIRQAADRLVAIPMSPGVESLNVAVATGILLYALSPRTSPLMHVR
jgi:TrmH family RNA methyltransferase